ncbi:uncharacterized protein LOC126817863 isoform X2 [Patella vulgata]|uniref:uncharacterized protein LOC126817863 isoform X2 n=1 Tax=Patella vulgata TaxID=6465 RepID=UPI00217F9379|nr:uncharacterized protein LOC126817863 isoform X2 [Patella vulgata]
MDWEYITKAVSEYILVYRISPFDEKSRRDLVQLEIKNMAMEGDDDRVTVTLNTDDKGTTTVLFTLRKVTEEDVDYNYFIEFRHSDSCSIISKPILLTLPEGPRMDVPNKYIQGTIGNTVKLIFRYYYRFPAISINVIRDNSPKLNYQKVGYWTESGYNPVIDDDRLVFHKQPILDGAQITLDILNTTFTDYSTYIFSVLFKNQQHVAIEIRLSLQSVTIESGSLVMMTVLPILTVLIGALVGLGIYGYKRKAKRVVNTSSNPVNNIRHSYISLNSVVIFHANRDSTATNTESIASNDTGAYANPYDPINRDGIDTSKSFYMSLQNPGTSNINELEDVQETNVNSNSVTSIVDVQTADDDDDDDVTNIDDVQTADEGDDTSTADDDDDDDDDVTNIDDVQTADEGDDTSTLDSNPYNALNKYTMNSDIHSYISLPPGTRPDYGTNDLLRNSSIVDGVMTVKKRPSTI